MSATAAIEERPQDPGKDQNENPSGDTKPGGNKNEAKPGTGEENGNTSKDGKEKESGKPFIKGEDGKEGQRQGIGIAEAACSL